MDKRDLPYYNAAKKLGLKIVDCNYNQGFFFIYDGIKCLVKSGALPINFASNAVNANKMFVSRMLSSHGLPVAKAVFIVKEEYEESKLESVDISYPVVAKPISGAMGKDVVCNIRNASELEEYLDEFMDEHEDFIIERFYNKPNSYRVLVLDNEVIALTLRVSARITGDGKHTIDEIIDIKNRERRQVKGVSLGPIKKDQEFYICLDSQGLTEDSIPDAGQLVLLHYKCNSTNGGTMEGLSLDMICEENANLCIEAASLLGLRMVGFDIVCDDIGQSIIDTGGIIVEGNHFPDITIHESPMSGEVTHVAEKILLSFIKRNKIAYYKHKLGKIIPSFNFSLNGMRKVVRL